MNFSDFVTDILGLQEGLMSDGQRSEAQAAYTAWTKQSETRNKWKAGQKVLADRAVAALFGGKALTGSTKQKVWAEKIRAEKLRGEKLPFSAYERNEMTDAQAVLACAPAGLGKSAHFWIENRDRKPSEIGSFFETQKRLLAEAQALRQAGKMEEFKAAAEAYNNLTAEWGFTK
ncbi:hypothetical protein [Coralloluteibacterium thermophilus]|uniref:Uncharacterized protein n=1 Tax=Coralloluteibacterium thermophilum TaxID=2707049 RepID=A0ABV9NRD9_9GAMM